MFHSHKLTALLPFLLLAVACGGDDGDDKKNDSGGDFTTSVPNDKPLGSLTDAESQQLCEDLSDYLSGSSFSADAQEVVCRSSGILAAVFSAPQTDAAARSACKTAYDECKAAPAESNQQCDKPDASCMATVDDYKACMADMPAYLDQVKGTFPSCAELTLDDFDAIAGEPPATPASCAALDTKCPDGGPDVVPGGAP